MSAIRDAVPLSAPRENVEAVRHIHRPKVEVFDTEAGTNTDPKGFVRAVDEYRMTDFGLYMARAMPGHPRMRYMVSWLLPDLGLRVNDWRWHPGHEEELDFYVDVVDIERDGPTWHTRDLYLDVTVYTGRRLEVLDTDELLAAVLAGLIDADAAQRALERVNRTVDGLASHGYDVGEWLAPQGIHLTWPPK
ncbi:DUF402 domain-containing protein [Herbihabitans rhizosphaerae]|nr:DUF402 domain-containing protein [Herbihabitans rhizosphaerae]